ncbi:MAG: sulfatase-like hydrolase/transferase [Defluviitaleaceae bacterium]|nr:sulfatase-like hydrolase/transferase [Defluviitaleaceae bacterium]
MKKPNVIVFMTDQQRWDTCGFHGNPLGLTPNLDRAAANGTDLHLCFTCQPVCGPARSVLQTGLYPTETGTFTNGRPLPHDTLTMAKIFKENGYQTGYVGKWHLAKGTGEKGGVVPEEDRGGYDYWLASNVLEITSDAYRTRMFDNDNNPVDLPGYRADALTDAAIRYIDTQKNNPFFLFISYIEPHFQNHLDNYPAPDGYEAKYKDGYTPPDLAELKGTSARHLPGYYGMVKRLDEGYGRIRDALKSLNIGDDTIILFVTDHGCHFKTRNDEYKRSGHESSIRIPCVLTGPGFDGGGRIRSLISLVDLPPTLLDAAGINVPDSFQGRSLLPLVSNKKAPWRDDMFVQISEASTSRAIRTSRFKYIVTSPDSKPWSDTGSAESYTETELYDLHADPYELNNLIGYQSHQPLHEIMRRRLTARMVEAGEKAPVIIPAAVQHPGQKLLFDWEWEL